MPPETRFRSQSCGLLTMPLFAAILLDLFRFQTIQVILRIETSHRLQLYRYRELPSLGQLLLALLLQIRCSLFGAGYPQMIDPNRRSYLLGSQTQLHHFHILRLSVALQFWKDVPFNQKQLGPQGRLPQRRSRLQRFPWPWNPNTRVKATSGKPKPHTTRRQSLTAAPHRQWIEPSSTPPSAPPQLRPHRPPSAGRWLRRLRQRQRPPQKLLHSRRLSRARLAAQPRTAANCTSRFGRLHGRPQHRPHFSQTWPLVRPTRPRPATLPVTGCHRCRRWRAGVDPAGATSRRHRPPASISHACSAV